jgi:hypothetical protein
VEWTGQQTAILCEMVITSEEGKMIIFLWVFLLGSWKSSPGSCDAIWSQERFC